GIWRSPRSDLWLRGSGDPLEAICGYGDLAIPRNHLWLRGSGDPLEAICGYGDLAILEAICGYGDLAILEAICGPLTPSSGPGSP
ncbi:MAG TPA: hypothetical protein PLJ78_10295, partial [Anaerolineae bacterium]|nr:hypothetical protein [Anaerolineae bacterium]